MILSIIAVLVIFSLLIASHEFGHLIGAKITRIGVEKFSIGFGHPILKKKIKETEYQLSPIPLGGFVKLEGEDFETENGFYTQPLKKKIVVGLGGPIANFFLAIIIFFFIFVGYGIERYNPRVFVREDTEFSKGGIKTGDWILSIDGKNIEKYEDILKILRQPGEYLFTIRRQDSILTLNLSLSKTSLNDIQPFIEPVIEKVEHNSPAERAGIKAGDRIVQIGHNKIRSWQEITFAMEKIEDSVYISWVRQNDTLSSWVTPEKLRKTTKRGIGIWVHLEREKMFIHTAFLYALTKTGEITVAILSVLWRLILGEASLQTLGGPIMIAQLSVKTAQMGLLHILSLLAILAINLGIVNLFPIPALDGGRCLIFVIEEIRGKRFGKRGWETAIMIGWLLLIVLVIIVVYNDILRILQK